MHDEIKRVMLSWPRPSQALGELALPSAGLSVARELVQPSCESCLLCPHHEMAPPLITGEEE